MNGDLREKKTLIKKTLDTISKLPQQESKEVSDFADFILKRYEEKTLRKEIKKLVSDSKTFDFLKEEEELYSPDD